MNYGASLTTAKTTQDLLCCFLTVLYTDVDTLSQLQVNIQVPSDVDAILSMKLH